METQFTQKVVGNLVCRQCGSENFSTELKSNNLVATCDDCDSFIKNIPYQEPQFYFGKYKGTPIKEIIDLDYLLWALNKVKLSKSLRECIIKRIDSLQYLSI